MLGSGLSAQLYAQAKDLPNAFVKLGAKGDDLLCEG